MNRESYWAAPVATLIACLPLAYPTAVAGEAQYKISKTYVYAEFGSGDVVRSNRLQARE